MHLNMEVGVLRRIWILRFNFTKYKNNINNYYICIKLIPIG